MQIIKLESNTAHPTQVVKASAVEGWTKGLWVERYAEPGEFKLEGKMSSGLLTKLPTDSLISHVDTSTVMAVENHEILQPKDEDPTIIITGRCLTAFMEERTVGDYQPTVSSTVVPYTLPEATVWANAVTLIDEHIVDPHVPEDALVGVSVDHSIVGAGAVEERDIKFSNVLKALQDLLAIEDLGIKSIRPSGAETDIIWRIHRGQNISKNVRFSWTRGDLENLEYFYSRRRVKNQVRVVGRWVQVLVNPSGADNYARRTALLDASDIDQQSTAAPTGGTLTTYLGKMTVRGLEFLKAQEGPTIVVADVAPTTTYQFGVDYSIGDLVTVDGDFGTSEVMRVVEYAIAEDESGIVGVPTLAIPGSDAPRE